MTSPSAKIEYMNIEVYENYENKNNFAVLFSIDIFRVWTGSSEKL